MIICDMKTGETIEINGVTLEAVDDISNICCSCLGCFFYPKGCCPVDDDKNLLCTTKDDIIIFKKK